MLRAPQPPGDGLGRLLSAQEATGEIRMGLDGDLDAKLPPFGGGHRNRNLLLANLASARIEGLRDALFGRCRGTWDGELRRAAGSFVSPHFLLSGLALAALGRDWDMSRDGDVQAQR